MVFKTKQTPVKHLVHIIVAAALLWAVVMPLILAQRAQAYLSFPGYNGVILFEVQDTDTSSIEIYKINADNTGLTNLTNDPANDTKSSWKPDGTKILFTSDRTGVASLYTMNYDGTDVTMITDGVIEVEQGAYSYDGTKIAFSTTTSDLIIMNADGSSPTQIVAGELASVGTPYIWSPDGLQLAYSHDDSDDASLDLVTINVDGTNPTTILDTEDTAYFQAWSPDGSKIAYTLFDETGFGEVYTIKPDGSDNFQVSHTSSGIFVYIGASTWSQDSTRLVFVVYDDGAGTFTATIVDADGTNQQPILDGIFTMSWSPDNTRILAARVENGTGLVQLITSDPDGTNQQNLSETAIIGETLGTFSWQPLTIPPTSNQPNPSIPYAGAPITYNVVQNTTDAYGGVAPGSVTIIEQPTQGTVSVDPATGIITYTPNASTTSSTDHFTYRVCSGASSQLCTTNTITISDISGGGELAPTGTNAFLLYGLVIVVAGGSLVSALSARRKQQKVNLRG